MRRAFNLSFISMSLLSGCSSGSGGSNGDSRRSPTVAGPAETTYCSSPVSYSGGVTITGMAEFNRRVILETGLTPGLGSADPAHLTRPAETRPIRAAEIRVVNSAGVVVQCSQTNPTNGSFSFVVPGGSASYTIYVNSRSAQFNSGNIYMNASVLNRPENNQFYSITASVNPSVSTSVGTMTADAYSPGMMTGAAFNILDMIYESNAYLRTQTASCTGFAASCNAVTLSNPVPKVSVYWDKGFNPNDYFGSSSGISFYLPGYSRIFILGGLSGDVDSSDTDHFDNSVIVHEYGHFLEDSMSVSDSPGGSHNGNKVLDPRLAWSEGWGNFFQAAVLYGAASTPKYIDSSGNIDGDPDLYFNVNLELASSGADRPDYQGEGNFREFSVTRMLWDAIDTVGDTMNSATDTVSGDFPEIWAAFTASSKGNKDGNYAFRNIGLIHYSQQLLTGASNWSTARTVNFHDGNTGRYASYVATSGTCATLTTGLAYSIDPSAGAGSTLFQQHRYFHVRVTTGTHTFKLRYKTISGTVKADLDLALYAEDHSLGTNSGLLARAELTPDQVISSQSTESITLALPAGNYLLDVSAYTGSDGGVNFKNAQTTEFSIQSDGGSDLCPASL